MAMKVIIFHKLRWSGLLLFAKFSSDPSPTQKLHYYNDDSKTQQVKILDHHNLQDSVHGMRIHAAMLQQLKEQCDQKNEELETKKRRGKEIEAALESSPCQISEERLSLLDIHQLKHLKEKMEKLRENVRRLANAPQLDFMEPPNLRNVAEPPIPNQVDLANFEREERDASPIPPDWLKL